MVRVAQLVRVLDCGSKGRGFEPHLSPKNKRLFDFKQPFFVRVCEVYRLKATHRDIGDPQHKGTTQKRDQPLPF